MSDTTKDVQDDDENTDVGDEFSDDYVTGDHDLGYDEYPDDDEPEELDFDDKNAYRSPRNSW